MEGKKAKKPLFKRWWFWVIVVIIAMAVLGDPSDDNKEKPEQASSGQSEQQSEESTGDKEESQEEELYQVGEPFEAGKLGAKILEVEEKEEFESDNEFVDSVKTDGKFIVVTAELTNNDEKARTFSSMQFKIVDDQNREFEAMTDADIMLILGDKNLFLESCNPGMSRTGVFVFEVPENIESYSLKVYSGVGTAAKGSVTVKLK